MSDPGHAGGEPARRGGAPGASGVSTPPARRWSHRLARRLPIVGWIARSDAESRRADLLAGLTVAAMLVPQGMAYAALAGMPPVTGLYASTVPLVVYALLGTSGQLAVGPVAIVSLLTASTVAPIAGGDPGAYLALAGMLALLVGTLQIALGLLRAGRLTNLLSHPVISGFTSAAAIVIATTQLDKLLGVSIVPTDRWLDRLAALAGALSDTDPTTLALGVVAIAVMLVGRRVMPRVPMALIVVLLAATTVPLLGLADRGVAVVGQVPGGLPLPTLPLPPADAIVALLPGAVIIALLSYLEGISVARAIAARTRDRIDPDQELVASGAANLAAGLLQAFPVAGGFSRTAVNHDAGARSPLASIVTAVTVLLALLLFAPLLRTVPDVVLAAVILVAVAGLISWRQARQAWRVERTDGIALSVTFVATLGFGVEIGIAVGIGASVVLSLWRVGVPRIGVEDEPTGTVVRMEGELLPASGVRLLELVEERLDRGVVPRSRLELDLSGVPSADLSGVEALGAIDGACAAADVDLHLTGLRAGVLGPLRRSSLAHRLGHRLHPYEPAVPVADSAHRHRTDAHEEMSGHTGPL